MRARNQRNMHAKPGSGGEEGVLCDLGALEAKRPEKNEGQQHN
jgi:hypothetical protein